MTGDRHARWPLPLSVSRLLAGAAVAIAPASVAAQTTIPSITVTAGGGYSTNPFLTQPSRSAISTQIDVRPEVQFIDGVSEGAISASYNRADYLTGGLGSNDGYGVNASASTRLNPRTSLGVTALYDSQILGAGTGFFVPSTLTVPTFGTGTTTATGTTTGTTGAGTTDANAAAGITPIVINPVGVLPGTGGISGDVGLIGLRQRRNTIQAAFNGNYIPSARSTLSFGLTGSRSSYPGSSSALTQLGNFTSYGANVGYSRALSEISSGGVQMNVSKVDYARGFSSQIYTPRLTYSRSLSSRWSLTAAAGAGIVRERSVGTNVSLSVEGSLCRVTERGQGCVTAARLPSATGLGGISVLTSAGLSYSQRLAASLSLGVGASYSHVGGSVIATGTGLVGAGGQDLYSGNVSLQRQIGSRLSIIGQGSYRHVNSPFISGSDLGARLGLSWSAGGR